MGRSGSFETHKDEVRVMSDNIPNLEQIIHAAESLPPFPDVVWKVMPLVQQMAPVAEIEAVIRYDQAITARVLTLSQSAYYARRHAISSLRDAIVCLGQQQLLKVVMAACCMRYFETRPAGYDLREGELWEHAVATALMAELLAKRLGWKNIFTAYTAALLHDIGKTVLHFYVETCSDSILALVRDKSLRFLDAEREVLGIDHQQLGMIIARHWDFPKDVAIAVGYHHSPLDAVESQDLAGLVYMANRMVSALGIGCGVDGFLQPNQDEAFIRAGITLSMVEHLLADLVEVLKQTKEALSAA